MNEIAESVRVRIHASTLLTNNLWKNQNYIRFHFIYTHKQNFPLSKSQTSNSRNDEYKESTPLLLKTMLEFLKLLSLASRITESESNCINNNNRVHTLYSILNVHPLSQTHSQNPLGFHDSLQQKQKKTEKNRKIFLRK